jgi:NADH-quinone oxidoreductase subunit N
MGATASLLAQLDEPLDLPAVEWSLLAPLLILIGGSLLLLTISALSPRKLRAGISSIFTVVTCLVAVGSAVALWDRVQDPARGPATALADAITIDGFSLFFTVLIALSIALVALLADDYLRREGLDGPELYALMILSGAGGVTMAMANDLIVVFLGLEILSIAIYVMAGMHLRRIESQESAIKYFVLGAFSSAFLLYGIALVYGATGTTNLSGINAFLADNLLESEGLLLAGFALLLVGLAFKVSAVPFHLWTPDVYQGAPSPVTAFMASVSKAASFAALLRIFSSTFAAFEADWRPIVWVMAVLTLVVGAVLAVVQRDVKRMLAYSSISHAGFVLVGVEAHTEQGVAGALFYLLAYAFLVIGSFVVVTLVGRRGDAAHDLDDYRGVGRDRPALALAFTVLLLSQAGVPLTSGFFAKFYVIGAAADAGSYALALIAMVSAVISAFLYLRIIVAMYFSGGEDDDAAAARPRIAIPAGAAVSLTVAIAFTLVVGVLPGLVADVARDAIPVLLTAAP